MLLLLFLGGCALIVLIVNIYQLKSFTGNVSSILHFVALYPILVLITMIALTLFPLLWIFKQLVGVILKMWLGSNFHGLADGLDVIHVTDPNPGITQLLMVFEYDTGMGEWYDFVKCVVSNWMERNFAKHPKLFSVVDSVAGYFYMKKVHLTAEDCVKKLKVVGAVGSSIDRDELVELISECYHNAFPANDNALWDIYVGTQPLVWNPEEHDAKKTCFPVVLRSCPGLVSSVCLSTLWNSLCPIGSEPTRVHGHRNEKSTIWNNFRTLIGIPSALFTNLILKGHDTNVLRGKPVFRRECLGIESDLKGVTYTKVRNIVQTMLKTTVSEVMLTAYTASLNEYIEQNFPRRVENVTALMQILMPTETNPQRVLQGYGNVYITIKVPLTIEDHPGYNDATPLMSRLHVIKELRKRSRNSLDNKVFVWVSKYFCAVLPKLVVKYLLSKIRATTGVSLSAPITTTTFCEGRVVLADCCIWLPHTSGLYSQFSVMSCGDKFQLGFNSDSVYFGEHKNAQSIVDGVCKYIDLLEKEIIYMYD